MTKTVCSFLLTFLSSSVTLVFCSLAMLKRFLNVAHYNLSTKVWLSMTNNMSVNKDDCLKIAK